ncbi:MAG: hypothetical protein GY842_18500, partial [bacterium]|nr:hypothetical protein [bacterium]
DYPMPDSLTTHPELDPAADRNRRLKACIDLDRFCIGCAYNLRTQPVWLDERLGIPVVRCPECGRCQSANDAATALRPWLDRAASLFLLLWMLGLLALFANLALAEGALSYGTLDELTSYGGYTTQRIGNQTIRTWVRSGPLEVTEDPEMYNLFMTLVMTGSFVTAFVTALAAVIVFHHWRRVAYLPLVLGLPLVATVIVATTWLYEAPHLFDWGLSYLLIHLGVQFLGALIGVQFGRPFARGVVRVFLPPNLRPKLAFLWLADGKPPPPTVKATNPEPVPAQSR